MRVGNHVRRINGSQFIGVVTKVFSREKDAHGNDCVPFTMVCVTDANGGVAVGPQGDFEITRH